MKKLFLILSLLVSSVGFSQTTYKVSVNYREIGIIENDSVVNYVSMDSISKKITIVDGVSLTMDSTDYTFVKQEESNPGVFTFKSINEKTKENCTITYFNMCSKMNNVMALIVDIGNKSYYFVGTLE